MLLALSTTRVFFFNDTATTEIYTLSLHDALPICIPGFFPPVAVEVEANGKTFEEMHLDGTVTAPFFVVPESVFEAGGGKLPAEDRKSTRLNSSHSQISYAVFCLKKKNKCRPHRLSAIQPHGAVSGLTVNIGILKVTE